MNKENEDSISLNKYISSTGICSRREADKMIEAERVTLNGLIATKGNRVFEGDDVRIDDEPLAAKPKALYIAFNKPVGIVCTTDQNEPKNIVSYINHPQRLFPIGRLDKPSEGLIFLTNDGDIVNKILRSGNNHEKEYIVRVNKKVTSLFVNKMRKGVPILGTITKRCKVIQLDEFRFKIILTQGLNRQIRRMCEYLDYKVVTLKRVRIMNVTLDKIGIGMWRKLTVEEMADINQLIANSSKTEEASRDRHKNKYHRR